MMGCSGATTQARAFPANGERGNEAMATYRRSCRLPTANQPGLRLLCEQFQTTKWVPDPIEERARAIQPWSMTLSQAGGTSVSNRRPVGIQQPISSAVQAFSVG
jgi:hypothetical protein